MHRIIILILYSGLGILSTFADTIRCFSLGEVLVLEKRPAQSLIHVVSQERIQQYGVYQLSEALNLLPGITLGESADRNEGKFFLRGFEQKQVPVFLDGIPISVPYDGYIDLNRLQTFSVAKIEVTKGLTSLLLGGNALGGAVHIASERPEERFLLSAEVSSLFSSSVRMATRYKKVYAQLAGGWIHRGDFRLPRGFVAENGKSEGKRRDNSESTDYQLGAQVGYVPRVGHEYVLGYAMIRSHKGIPAYLGDHGRVKYWKYKQWDKNSFFMHTRTPLNEHVVLELRHYYDLYDNTLEAYDDSTYTTQNGRSSFTSVYDDYATGGTMQLAWATAVNNKIKLGVNSKYEVHRGHNVGEPRANQREWTNSVAMEDEWMVNRRLTLMAGAGVFLHKGLQAQIFEPVGGSKVSELVDYPRSRDRDFNYQAGLSYDVLPLQQLRLSLARSSRFASLKERYSYKMGKALPNPYLGTEQAYTLDLGYEGRWDNLRWSWNGYMIRIENIIQEVTGVDPEDAMVWQLQNRGRARFMGTEVGVDYAPWSWVLMGVNYALTGQKNLSNPELRFIDVPRHKLNVFTEVRLPKDWRITADVNYSSKRYSRSDGSSQTAPFTTVNLHVQKVAFQDFIVKGGVRNLFDRLYYITEGYPQPGREFFVSVRYNYILR